MLNLKWSFTFTLLFVTQFAFAQHYDEIRDASGNVRPEYVEVYSAVMGMSKVEKRQFLKRSFKAFKGDNRLDPMPRIIPSNEFDDVIVKGVEQRGRALMAFLQDHYSGRQEYRAFMSREVVARIIERSGEGGYDRKIPLDTLGFPYGPDIIRDSAGIWRVVEDNPGFIGGPGDLRLARRLILDHIPGVLGAIRPRDPEDFYRELTDTYKARAREFGGKPVLILSAYDSDMEDGRITDIMRSYGIESAGPRGKYDLEIRPDGIYTFLKGTSSTLAERVGFLVMQGEHNWFDPTHPAAWEKLVLDEAREFARDPKARKGLRAKMNELFEKNPSKKVLAKMAKIILRSGVPTDLDSAESTAKMTLGLIDLVHQKKVGTNYSPGVDFIGDKEFYVHVEDMIRFYLKEEPLLRNIETQKFADSKGRLNTSLVETVFSNIAEYVVKRVDGRGGNAVWVGPKISPHELNSLKEKIALEPEFYIVQKYTPLSTLDNLIVDMRVISEVNPHSVTVANTAWGRGLPLDGDGKVNLSTTGREIAILIDQTLRTPKTCSGLLQKDVRP
jgi:uncharacterized circularly permuted ATP-grasp superfamily protein